MCYKKTIATRFCLGITFSFIFTSLCIAGNEGGGSLAHQIASSAYLPADEAELSRRSDHFSKRLQSLRKRFLREPNGKSWLKYLMCGAVEEAIKKFPDLEDQEESREALNTVSRCYYRLAGLHPGIDHPQVVAYRDSLKSLRLSMSRILRDSVEQTEIQQWKEDVELFPDDEEIKEDEPVSTSKLFADKTERLSQLVSDPSVLVNAISMQEMASIVSWLRKREQIPNLLDQVESRFGRINLDVHISAGALGDMTVTPAYEVKPIHRVEDGVQINGKAVVSGSARMYPVLSSRAGRCEVRFSGNVVTTLHGQKGPASFNLRGDTTLTATKPVVLRSHQLSVERSVAYANTQLSTQRVCSKFRGILGRLVRRIAAKEIGKERPQASYDMSKESATSFLEEFDQQITDEIMEGQQSLDQEVHRPLGQLDLRPRRFDFVTDPQRLRVNLQFGTGVCTPSESTTQFMGSYDVQAKVHESMINAVCDRMFAGRPIQNFRDVVSILGVDVPAEQMEQIPEDVGLHFSEDNPIRIAFERDRVKITISAVGWKVSGFDLVGMTVSFAYRINQSGGKQSFELDEEFEITAPGGRESGRFFQQKNVLERLLEKELPASIPIESISVQSLPEMVDKLGNLNFAWLDCADGWLQVVILGDRAPRAIPQPPQTIGTFTVLP